MTELLARWVETARKNCVSVFSEISARSITSLFQRLTKLLIKTRICDAEILLKSPVDFVDCWSKPNWRIVIIRVNSLRKVDIIFNILWRCFLVYFDSFSAAGFCLFCPLSAAVDLLTFAGWSTCLLNGISAVVFYSTCLLADVLAAPGSTANPDNTWFLVCSSNLFHILLFYRCNL